MSAVANTRNNLLKCASGHDGHVIGTPQKVVLIYQITFSGHPEDVRSSVLESDANLERVVSSVSSPKQKKNHDFS